MDHRERWPGEPEKCHCRRMVVGTIEETLDCPLPWFWRPRIARWVHS
jgi:hypothetical protein